MARFYNVMCRISQIFAIKNFFVDDLFRQKLNTRNILCNVRRPIPILVAKIWQRNLDYAKNLQAKYFTGKIAQSMVI